MDAATVGLYNVFLANSGLTCRLIHIKLLYGEYQVPMTVKRTSSNDTVLTVQDCSFEGELYWAPKICRQAKCIGTSFWNNMYVCCGVIWVQNLCL